MNFEGEGGFFLSQVNYYSDNFILFKIFQISIPFIIFVFKDSQICQRQAIGIKYVDEQRSKPTLQL